MAARLGDRRHLHRTRDREGRRWLSRGARTDRARAGGGRGTSRADRVAARVEERGLDALLITRLPNLRWTTGFTGSSGAALIGPGARVFFTDFRYTDQSRTQVTDFDHVSAGTDLLLSVAEHMRGTV